MKVNEMKLVITKMEEAFDKEGCVFLKCKGYHRHKDRQNKTNYDQFTSIRLYPCNEEQYYETKHRFLGQTVPSPKLNILAYDCYLKTFLIGDKMIAMLEVDKYDFEKNKLFNKRELVKKGDNE